MMTDTKHMQKSGSEESHVERARRGPTPDNPSLSLKKRLKRAAFFDQRERLAAEGKAVPVDSGARLPDASADDRFMFGSGGGSHGSEARPSA